MEIKENESICTGCDKKINNDFETKWDNNAQPFCKKCFKNELCEGCGEPILEIDKATKVHNQIKNLIKTI